MKYNNLRKILFPLSVAYHGVTSVRNKLYDLGLLNSKKFEVPTIVVGNLSVGGTGKTPMVEYLIRLLSDRYKVAVLSRGYKRTSKGFILAGEDATAQLIGDEPFQYHSKFKNSYVAVDSDRVHGVEQLMKLQTPPSLILLDDAFQHRKLVGGLNVLLTKYHSLFTRDLLLPAGNLRESVAGAKRSDLMVVTKCPSDLSKSQQQKMIEELNPAENQSVFFTKIRYSERLEGHAKMPLQELKDFEVLLFTGIADAKPLVDFLNKKQVKFKHLEFPDHHHYAAADLLRIKQNFERFLSKNKLILTTEKDYVRCADQFSALYYLPIEVEFVGDKTLFDQAVLNYVDAIVNNSPFENFST